MNHEPKKECFKTSVGGQALMEGIMMRGPEHICCAVRKPDGTIETKIDDTPKHGIWARPLFGTRRDCSPACRWCGTDAQA